MSERLAFLLPEISLFVATCVVMVIGLSRTVAVRKATAVVAGLGLAVALFLSVASTPHSGAAVCPISGVQFAPPMGELSARAGQLLLPDMVPYAKTLIAAVGLLMLLVQAGTVDRYEEAQIASGARTYDPLRTNRAEYYAFFLFSLTGLMLVASADDLIWLFLALELTSLPTYIMVAISRNGNQSREAGVKYFFLGALGAAIFLFGFAFLYGGTGTTNLNEIAQTFQNMGINSIAMVGMLLALVGLGFKIAAVPMHFYTADVYQGAASQVSAFLAFVPKTAGMLAILLLCAAMGWAYTPERPSGLQEILSRGLIQPDSTGMGGSLPEAVRLLLWVMAALTMTVGNVLALLQTSAKRMLAYSSVAHSGYMLVGVIAGPNDGTFAQSGVAAVLLYLLTYGVMNLGCFAVLSALERSPTRDGEHREIDSVDDIKGLWRTHPALAVCMSICSLSLLGLPPLLGFWGKVPLFTSGIAAGEYTLVIVLGLNSAIAAFYYLRLAFFPYLDTAEAGSEPTTLAPFTTRRWAAALSAAGVIVLSVLVGKVVSHVERSARVNEATGSLIGPTVLKDSVTP